MSDPVQDVTVPQKPASDTHIVIVKLEAVHVDVPEIEEEFTGAFGLTHELISYPFTSYLDKELVVARIKHASVVITTTVPIQEDLLAVAPNLKCVIGESTGTNHIDLEACKRRGVTVYNSPNATMEAVSEHALAMYFTLRRRLLVLHNAMMQYTTGTPNSWRANGSMSGLLRDADDKPPRTCETEVAGILGSGPIGQRIATLCGNLGMRVHISARKTATTVPEGRTSFSEIMQTATVIFVVLPFTPETRSTISAAELQAMRPDAVVINVGRGGLVDEQALLDAVKERRIYGAATDVYEQEPAGSDADSVLLSRVVAEEGLNIVCTPHLAWCADTTRKNIQKVVKQNLKEFLGGGVVNMVAEGRPGI
ncbi:glycerate dehydrogenase [Plectosphaerella cucumerina]|uniref:Glycerate dehydrogenase n=1 Tax=Plectosphaerella cucumerina TaxID=40658 RepID=A0A8K0X355_9PEZI|nr:glycerate dehydrogenase [Plectosphaerella cucumerina]